jgi:chemotaxis protein MotD
VVAAGPQRPDAAPVRGRSEEHASPTGLEHRRPVARDLPAGAPEPAPLPEVEAAADVPPLAPAPPTVTPLPAPEPPRVAVSEGPAQRVLPAVVDAARHLRAEGGRTSLVVRLDPPELGAVVVRLTVQDGRVDVTLRTPDLAAAGDLQAQSSDVQQVLRDHGLDLASFDVAQGGGLLDGALGEGGSRPSPDRATRRGAGAADGADTVTDDVAGPQPAGTWL